jgi:glutamyl-tRNA synthetase
MKLMGGLLSKSKIVEGVRKGLFSGWDDPRLATFIALKKRGILPETIRRLIIEVGPKTVDVTLSWDNLYAINRKLIDPVANRYFFVAEPRKVMVGNVSKGLIAKLALHPDYAERGSRIVQIKPIDGEAAFWVSGQDAGLLKKGAIIRLMGLFNILVESVDKGVVEAFYHSKGHEEAKKLNAPLIHWVPAETGIPCEVVMPDASVRRGIAEEACRNLKSNDIVQFERFGFVRVDKVDSILTCYFSHR